MTYLITGATGSGKTWWGVNALIWKSWKKNNCDILTNTPFTFPKEAGVKTFRQIYDIYLETGSKERGKVIFIDEGQKLFSADKWRSFPDTFKDKLTQGRKHHLDFITTTQHISQIDVFYRRLVHVWYDVENIFRYPADDEKNEPLIQIVRIIERGRERTQSAEELRWTIKKIRLRVISKLWTRSLYDTFKDVGLEKYLCKIIHKDNKWTAKFYDRVLVERGRARL